MLKEGIWTRQLVRTFEQWQKVKTFEQWQKVKGMLGVVGRPLEGREKSKVSVTR